MTTRWKLLMEYDGRAFVGWQRQENGLSVQQALETALTRLTNGQVVQTTAAGRTDSGVHARGQCVHFDLEKSFSAETIRDGLNAHLRPYPASVLDACETTPDFSARFDALQRSYLYRIVNRPSPLTFERGLAWQVPFALDTEAMQQGAQYLIGKHDFSSFRATQCQAKSPVRTLDRLDVTREGPDVFIHAEARSFLHHQVRNIVGSLKLVGYGKWQPEDMAKALAARDRRAAGPTAPPDGLFFMRVDYP
ncbi:MAG: tRNA pseudouridine(38-40) synthase TruA [Alphaproteobacteria bacterium GWF2_58_20]|nr:MAG: tRNA pseudouridine(38-40) synthase TruA [Alphaproteobacteria bacterium GWF2_58_20]